MRKRMKVQVSEIWHQQKIVFIVPEDGDTDEAIRLKAKEAVWRGESIDIEGEFEYASTEEYIFEEDIVPLEDDEYPTIQQISA